MPSSNTFSNLRSGTPATRNEQVQNLALNSHATNQADIVRAKTRSRMKKRFGPKIKELGFTQKDISWQLNTMSFETMRAHLNSVMKSNTKVLGLGTFKDCRLAQEEFREKYTDVVDENITSNKVLKSFDTTADRVARHMAKENVLGVIVDVENEVPKYYVCYAKAELPEAELELNPPAEGQEVSLSGKLKLGNSVINVDLYDEKTLPPAVVVKYRLP